MKEVFEKVRKFVIINKGKVIVGAVILVVVIASIVLAICLSSKKDKDKDERPQKEVLTEYLEEIGKSFYEDYYYYATGNGNDDKRIEELKKREELGTGIIVDLDNLSRWSDEAAQEKIKEFVNKETDEPCDKKATKIIIYPKDPYKQTDYELETVLVCGFED